MKKKNRVGMKNNDPVISDSESETDSNSNSDSEQEDLVKLTEPSQNAINNNPALLDKLADITWPENTNWIHKLSVDVDHDQSIDVNDDLNRELVFFNQALEGARHALEKFQSMGLPFLRPSDYDAAMLKPDDTHMENVKGHLLVEKKKAEDADERRKSRENEKLAKEKQMERTKQKKDDVESVKKWRKRRKQIGFVPGEDGDFSKALEDGKSFEWPGKKRPGVGPGDRSGGKKGVGGKRKERDSKDSKFGFGGRKGLKKQNTAETTNDFNRFGKRKYGRKKKCRPTC